jgi:hypothetical protein
MAILLKQVNATGTLLAKRLHIRYKRPDKMQNAFHQVTITPCVMCFCGLYFVNLFCTMHNAPFFIKYKLHHLIIWMLVFGIWYNLRIQDYPQGKSVYYNPAKSNRPGTDDIYIANLVLVPHLLYKKKIFPFWVKLYCYDLAEQL